MLSSCVLLLRFFYFEFRGFGRKRNNTLFSCLQGLGYIARRYLPVPSVTGHARILFALQVIHQL